MVFFGAIHGNEHCGPEAMTRVMKRLEDDSLSLEMGSVRFVPICNPEAYAQNIRYTEENLNRVFKKDANARSYEAKRANELCALLDEYADMLVDIHSTSAPGPMSVFTDYPSVVVDSLARALGPEYILLDWPMVYANDPLGFPSSCTADYAHSIGIPSVTVECGQHLDPASIDTAERAILRALSYAGILKKRNEQFVEPKRIRMKYLAKKESNDDVFDKEWTHLEPVPKGSVIAKRASGDIISAEEDLVMILPKLHAKAGEEWFYVGSIV
jgi:predicted deacylase